MQHYGLKPYKTQECNPIIMPTGETFLLHLSFLLHLLLLLKVFASNVMSCVYFFAKIAIEFY